MENGLRLCKSLNIKEKEGICEMECDLDGCEGFTTVIRVMCIGVGV